MKISTRGRYALRLMLDLAQNSKEGGAISLHDVAKRQGVSKKYLEQIVPLLSKAGMLRSNRGYQGGYRLTKTPAEYTVGDVLRVTEGDLACVSCVLPGNNDCPREAECITKPVWDGLYQTVTTYLDSITLQDILDQYAARMGDQALHYSI
ncbi:RrF2 family transcriptional regulator [Ruminococcus sp.]|jgi:Rrf2 family protein|uniref:RrF2 family transcriptional regulator n=1 Tax=Ruminococcus sp. TaxID=41978 RepID=UPI0026136F3E|nr:Rrf2 family transcriptional regulator [Ruminococcus sp.]MEE0022089.1 Rrf2 family transcriptional regulator [Ruminococcus sp.]